MANSISCPVCGNLCSTQAASCPKCGHPISQTDQNVAVETNKLNQTLPSSPSTGGILRTVLWVFFAISVYMALAGINDYKNSLYPVGANAAVTDFQNKFYLVVHQIPVIIMIIVLAAVYSSKERRK